MGKLFEPAPGVNATAQQWTAAVLSAVIEYRGGRYDGDEERLEQEAIRFLEDKRNLRIIKRHLIEMKKIIERHVRDSS